MYVCMYACMYVCMYACMYISQVYSNHFTICSYTQSVCHIHTITAFRSVKMCVFCHKTCIMHKMCIFCLKTCITYLPILSYCLFVEVCIFCLNVVSHICNSVCLSVCLSIKICLSVSQSPCILSECMTHNTHTNSFCLSVRLSKFVCLSIKICPNLCPIHTLTNSVFRSVVGTPIS